ncbi:MAG: septation protein A [Hyphomicrobiales bacterium]|nr:MAG: septation protein A [Hyphomicrobiales bacterium]
MADVKTQQAEPSWDELKPQIIKMALELGPLVVFFIVNTMGEDILAAFPVLNQWFSSAIIFATAVFMVAMLISLALTWVLLRKIAMMPLITGVVVVIFGGLTLYFQDSTFIKMKPTITNTLFGVTLLGGLVFGQSLLRYVFGDVYKLQPEGWTKLTLRWGLFFLFLAVLNEVVWRTQSEDFWVAFKVWATMPITIVFSAAQLPLLTKYAPQPIKPVEAITPPDPLP